MSEAPTTVIEQVPTPAPANTPEARTPEGQLKAVTEPLIQTPPTPTATTSDTTAPKDASKDASKEASKEGEKTFISGAKQDMNGAPEKYEAFAAPEGYELNQERMEKAQGVFKELNLSQAGGQKLVNFFMDEIKSVMEAPQKAWEETRAQWLEQVKSHPEIGGKLDQVKITVAKAIDGFGDPKLANGFRQAMDFTGAGNNPDIILGFYKLAQKVTEGTSVTGGTMVEVNAKGEVVRNQPLSAARALYPNLK